jgi:ribosomal protein S18 acetylase RimI-like enzyme
MLELASLSHRTVASEDRAFLFDLYADMRSEELDAWGWNAQQRQAFLKMQFEAQQRSYWEQFPEGDYQLVLFNQQPVGSIFIVRSKEEIRLVDIALLHCHRNQGVGTLLIQKLLAEAAAAEKPVRLQVMKVNRAIRLYERLGFCKIGDMGTHFLMEAR